MKNIMTEETPGKVLSLLGASLFSLAFLFTVSASDASFAGAQGRIFDPFAPEKMMAAVDKTAAAYGSFLAMNLFQPLQADLAFYSGNVSWVIDNSADSILAITGLSSLARVDYLSADAPRIAGASVSAAGQNDKAEKNIGVLDSLFSLVLGD